MDFFKSVFSPDLDPEHDQSSNDTASASSNPNPNPTGGGWNLVGGLIKTMASKSESVIQTYRRDLEEFGSGLKKETAAIREVAARSVDEIIKHGKEVLAVDSSDDSFHNAAGKKYTRLEAQIMAIQSDEGTFITDPEDMKDFENWKIGFDLEEKKEEIEMLLYDYNVLESMSEKFIPDIVDYWTFWYRYFYRVYKVKQAEEARAELVKRVISRDEEEEELSWDVDDDEESEKIEGKSPKDGEKKRDIDEIRSGDSEVGNKKVVEKTRVFDDIEKIEGTRVQKVQHESEVKEELNELEKNVDNPMKNVEKDEKSGLQKGGSAETQETGTSKELENQQEEEATNASDEEDTASIPEPIQAKSVEVPDEVSTSTITKDEKLNLKSEAEEDLEWDELEDLGEGDDNKPSGSIASPNPKLKEDLHKRLSVEEDDEDLTWDIEEEDDDVPSKK
jgi:BSD domain